MIFLWAVFVSPSAGRDCGCNDDREDVKIDANVSAGLCVSVVRSHLELQAGTAQPTAQSDGCRLCQGHEATLLTASRVSIDRFE